MKTKLFLTFLLLIANLSLLISQVPQGFNYQAIARGPDGKEIANTSLLVRLSVLSDTTGFYGSGNGKYIYEEEQTVKTNSLGLFTLAFGDPEAKWIQGSVETFSGIDWTQQPLFIGTKINNGKWNFMGTSRLWSVPYAMNAGVASTASTAGNLSGPVDKLAVTGSSTLPDDILFEVKNKSGQTIFAVYNEGVRVFVEDGAKGSKGGFAIGGFGTAKAPSQEYFRVTRDSTRVYVNPNVNKGSKGGFAIGGFGAAKGIPDNFMELRKDNYFIGLQSGFSNTSGIYNSFMGFQTGYHNTVGSRNIFLGYQSGYSNSSGENNVFQGYQAGLANTTGSWNIFLGPYAGWRNKTGYSNIIIGNMAGYFCTSSENTFIGQQAGSADTSGMLNVFIGNFSGEGTTNGSNNTYLGYGASRMNQSGTNNISLGVTAGFNNHGNYNTLLGATSGYNNSNGSGNVFIGYGAGFSEAGSNKLIISNNQSGALIYGEFDNNLVRINGDLYAQSTLINNGIEVNTGNTGNRLAYIDFHGDDTYTDYGLRIIRSGTGPNSASLINHRGTGDFNIATNEGASLTFSTFAAERMRINSLGYVGFGTNAPATRVDIAGGNWNIAGASEGDFRIGNGSYRLKIGVATSGGGSGDVRMTSMGGTSRLIMGGNGVDVLTVTSTNVYPWTDNAFTLGTSSFRWSTIYAANGVINTSDGRLKSNIQRLDYGLESIMKLEPVSYTWKDGTDRNRKLGLIAQDVDKVISEVVDKGTDPAQTLGINYSELVPVLIKAIQEQQKQIDDLKAIVSSMAEERNK